jgi:hypothetical protein
MEDGWSNGFSRSAYASSWGVYGRDRVSLEKMEIEFPHHGKVGKNVGSLHQIQSMELRHNLGSYKQKRERTIGTTAMV